jgi:hypothetical protein
MPEEFMQAVIAVWHSGSLTQAGMTGIYDCANLHRVKTSSAASMGLRTQLQAVQNLYKINQVGGISTTHQI